MAQISITDPRITEYIEQLGSGAWLDKALFEAIGDILKIQTEERFDAQASPDGTPWHPLSRAYAAYKRKKGKDSRILHLETDLRSTLVAQANDYSVAFGSNRKYAAIHQFGGRFKAFGKYDTTMPARPYLGLSDDNVAEILEQIQEAFELWQQQNQPR